MVQLSNSCTFSCKLGQYGTHICADGSARVAFCSSRDRSSCTCGSKPEPEHRLVTRCGISLWVGQCLVCWVQMTTPRTTRAATCEQARVKWTSQPLFPSRDHAVEPSYHRFKIQLAPPPLNLRLKWLGGRLRKCHVAGWSSGLPADSARWVAGGWGEVV